MSRGRRRAVAVAAVAVLCAAVSASSVEPSTARFTDGEYAAGSFTASRLAVPSITSCTVTSLLGTFTGFTITWTSPYPKAQQRLSINTVVVDNGSVGQSGSGPWTYSATISSSVLSTLLGSLLGSSNTVRVEAVLPGTSWVSPAATRTLSVGGLLGLGGNNTCT
ncbi:MULTISPECIES: hypothetical protein [Microbacterium]|uniref:hypothetical protein n=1 Tax=Microbacterium TaxID=33882 RepID=UPI0011EAFCDC|nr:MULTISPECIES: hypothetical protein [Microbacterium]